MGLPITLSIVVLEVARRLGLDAAGIGLPGHFIVEVRVPERVLLDPFYGGDRLTEADCVERVRQISHGRARFHNGMLTPLAPRQILTRLLANLKNIYVYRGDHLRTLAVVDRLLLLDPDSPRELHDRAVVARQLGFASQSLADLRHYLRLLPNAADRSTVESTIRAIERGLAWLN